MPQRDFLQIGDAIVFVVFLSVFLRISTAVHAAQDSGQPRMQQQQDEQKGAASNEPSKPDQPSPGASIVLARDAGEFELNVVGPDGKPIPDAAIEFRNKLLLEAQRIRLGKFVRTVDENVVVTANSEGRLILTFPRNTGSFELRIIIPGYGPYRAEWTTASESQQVPAKFTAELDAAMSVDGIVVDAQENPVKGATIQLRQLAYKNRDGDTTRRDAKVVLTTNDEGKWNFDSLPTAGNPRIGFAMLIDHPNFMPVRQPIIVGNRQFGNAKNDFRKVTLRPGLTMTGHVTDEAGQPIAGAQIQSRNAETYGFNRWVTTDDQGAYSLCGCDVNVWNVVSAKGRATDLKIVKLEPDQATVDFQLKVGRKIRVRVLDQSGKPIPQAQINFQGWRDTSAHFAFEGVNRTADESGVWEWNEAPEDEFHADICRPNGLCLPNQTLKPRDEEYVFRVPDAFVVVGNVVDSETKKPVETFQATTAHRSHILGGDSRPIYRTIGRSTGNEGKYRLEQTMVENNVIADVIQIESKGYQSTTWQDITFENGKATIDFELKSIQMAASPADSSGKTEPNGTVNSKTASETKDVLSLPIQCEKALNNSVKTLNPCSIKYSQHREPPRPPLGADGSDGHFVLDGRRFYHRVTFSNAAERRAPKQKPSADGANRYLEYSFDGHVFYRGSSDFNRKQVTKYLGENTSSKVAEESQFDMPYLVAAGFFVPVYVAEWRSNVFDSAVLKAVKDGKLLKLTEQGTVLNLEMEIPDQNVRYAKKIDWDQVAKVNNQQAVADRYRKLSQRDPVRRILFKLDREKGYALVRQEDRTLDGKLIQTVDCEDFELFPTAEVWLPRTCITRSFTDPFLNEFAAEPKTSTTVKLDEISFVIPNDISFKIDYGPGSIVDDFSTATQHPESNK